MNKIDTKLIVHVGIESVIIGGLSFYFRKQINGLHARIEILEKQNEALDKALHDQDKAIKYIFDVLNGNPIRNPPNTGKNANVNNNNINNNNVNNNNDANNPNVNTNNNIDNNVGFDEEELNSLVDDELKDLE